MCLEGIMGMSCYIGYEFITKEFKRYTQVIEMDANRTSHVWDHDMVGYGWAIMLYTCWMFFLLIIDVWNKISLPKLKRNKWLYSWCCVWVEKERIQLIERIIGKKLDDVSRRWLDLPTHHGGIHELHMWYSRINGWMHCVGVAMGIGTLGYQ
jgi:hypothetical protein